MVSYILNTEKGSLQPDAPGKDETSEKEYARIILMNREEFRCLEGGYPYKKNLLRSLEAIRYCKAETFRDCIQGIMKIPKLGGRNHKVTEFGFYLHKDRLYLIEEENELKSVIEKIRQDVFEGCTLHEVLLLLFNFLIDEDILHLQRIEEQLEHIEDTVMKKIPEHFNEMIMGYRRQLSSSLVYYEQIANIGECMQVYTGRENIPDERLEWERYVQRAERLHNYVETIREYLRQIRDLYQTQIDIQQNHVISILTIVTTIFLPLTLITGWYGMNFPDMPEFGWKYAYPAVALVSLFIVLAEIFYFKKKRML